MRVLGIDLAAKADNPTGFATWSGGVIECWSEPADDRRVLRLATRARVVVIDAPLTPSDGPFRRRDERFRELAPVLPLTLPGMRKLLRRGVRLAERLRRRGVRVYETFPRAAERRLSLRGEWSDEHARDAALCCGVGVAIVEGWAETFGREPRAALPGRRGTLRVRARSAPPS
ncbi:MAG: hypothetical protein ABGY09_06315 [Euryarchaeota archaeon]